jgi:pimeloyl-ACP methyl ester carboxylesterase
LENSKFVTIDGIEVHYTDEGTGTPIVLLHDVALSLHIWDTWVETLEQHFRVIRLDLPGFGMTSVSAKYDYRMDSYIYFFKKFTAALGLGLELFHVCGVGFGGHIAWQYTLLHPHKVLKLVIINAQGYPQHQDISIFKIQNKSIFGRFLLRWSGTKTFVEKHLKKAVGDPSKISATFVQLTHDLLLCKGNRNTLVALSKTPFKDRHNRIGQIKTPTLLLWGSLIPDNRFAKDLPKAQVKTYENVGLLPMLEIPQRSLQDVMDFLRPLRS